MTDPLRQAASVLADFARELARLDADKAEIDRKIDTVLQVAGAHGYDRAALRTAARSIRDVGPDGPFHPATELGTLYIAAVTLGE